MTINIPKYEELFEKLRARFADNSSLPELEERMFPLFRKHCGKKTVPFWMAVWIAKVVNEYLGDSADETQVKSLFDPCLEALVEDEMMRVVVQEIFDNEFSKFDCYYRAL